MAAVTAGGMEGSQIIRMDRLIVRRCTLLFTIVDGMIRDVASKGDTYVNTCFESIEQ